MTTSVTGDLPAEQPAGPEPATATPLTASPAAGSEQVQSRSSAQPEPTAATAPAQRTALDLGSVGRIPVLAVSPVVDGGRFDAKAVVGEPVPVSATVFREGHDAVAATAVLVDPDGVEHTRARMTLLAPGTDRYGATVVPDREGRWSLRVEGWSDLYGTWEHAALIKVPAGLDVELTLEEGARVLERAAAVPGLEARDVDALGEAVAALRDADGDPQERLGVATGYRVHDVLTRHPLRDLVTASDSYPLVVQRERALFSAWYEFFPRSEGAHVDPATGRWVSGTFAEAAKRLPAIRDMGFDIVYLPPIHPIGHTARKGRNNTLTPAADDPGVPWAIGSKDGGHDAIHPDLGTFDDFREFVAEAGALGLEVALDLALQCSPDHPWVREHPEWFTTRADGSIAYAENPPKKYQDIYPLNFDNDPEGLYAEVLRVVRLWIDHGVTVFRVDNPHTKPVEFWQWLFREVARDHPEVIFLAEAFTRPAMMHTLGKVGFQQSYTYFTWRNTPAEMREYLTELSGDAAAYMRPNFWPNTPDILHEFLQYGGPAAFKLRAVLASTLSPSWGMYSGYELCEHVALRAGSEEYLDSEKYQYRPRDWEGTAGRSLAPYITTLNRIRAEHPALHYLRNVAFHRADDENFLVYSRRLEGAYTPDGVDDTVIVVVNMDPHAARETTLHLDMPALGFDWHDTFEVHDLFTGATYRWGEHDYVRLDPFDQPAHVLHVRPIR
jgi:starch synthase (maltosyl-transferring)